jgi:hypothetical protein
MKRIKDGRNKLKVLNFFQIKREWTSPFVDVKAMHALMLKGLKCLKKCIKHISSQVSGLKPLKWPEVINLGTTAVNSLGEKYSTLVNNMEQMQIIVKL